MGQVAPAIPGRPRAVVVPKPTCTPKTKSDQAQDEIAELKAQNAKLELQLKTKNDQAQDKYTAAEIMIMNANLYKMDARAGGRTSLVYELGTC